MLLACPTNLESHALAVFGDERRERQMTKIRTSCVITLYYVLVHDRVEALLCRPRAAACVAKLDLLEILRERTYSLVTS